MPPAPRTASEMSGAGIDAGELERGGMELEKLDVPELGADLPGQRPAVAGGHRGIGGDGVELADAAGGEHHVGGVDFARDSVRARAITPITRRPSCRSAGTSVCSRISMSGMAADHLGQAADQRGAGPVAAGVDDPGPGVGRLEPEAEPPVGAAVEHGAQRQQLANPVGAFIGENPYRFGVGQAVAGGQGVGGVLAGAVARARAPRRCRPGPRRWRCRPGFPW